MDKKTNWYHKWSNYYQDQSNFNETNEILNIRESKILVYDEGFRIKNNINQKARETFVFPILQSEYKKLSRDFEILCNALEKYSKYILSNEDLRLKLNLKNLNSALELSNPILFDYVRFDGFYNESTFEYKLIEINAFSPSMYENSDLILGFTNKKQSPLIAQLIAKSHAQISHLNGKKSKRNILILTDQSTGDEYIQEIKLQLGVHIIIFFEYINKKELFPHFNFDGTNLTFDGQVIDQLIIRSKHKIFSKTGKIINNFVQLAYENMTLQLIPSPKNLINGKKSLFPFLISPTFQSKVGLNEEEILVISKMIPKSVEIENYEEIDDILDSKDQWVLKYSDRSSGKHIYIGAKYSKEEWITLLKTAYERGGGIILQERINIPHSDVILHGKPQPSLLPFSFEPFLVNLPLTQGYVIAGFSGRAYLGDTETAQIKFNPSSNNENIAFGTGEIIDI